MNRFANSRARQTGQSMTEYVVIIAILAGALLAVKSGVGQELANAIRAFYSNILSYISLP